MDHWTHEEDQQLREMAAQGLSSADMADKLYPRSRNSIIGRIHRHKIAWNYSHKSGMGRSVRSRDAPLTFRANVPRREMEHSKQPDTRDVGRRGSERSFLAKDNTYTFRTAINQIPAMPKPQNMDNTYNPHGILFSEFVRGCRFPIGDPKSKDFKVCGNLTVEHLPYCVPHARVAFQKTTHHAPVSEAGKAIPTVDRIEE